VTAPRRRQSTSAASRSVCVAVTAKWVLIPIGTGDTAHLDEPISMPSTIILGDNKLVVGRELSQTVNFALPVPTGA